MLKQAAEVKEQENSEASAEKPTQFFFFYVAPRLLRLYFWPGLESLRVAGFRRRTPLATLHTNQITRQLSPAWKNSSRVQSKFCFCARRGQRKDEVPAQASILFIFFTCPRQSGGGVNGVPFMVSVGDGRVTSPSGGPLDVLIQTRTLSSSVWRQRIGSEAGTFII